MLSFKNIDEFIPRRFETTGMLKGKRWYTDSKRNRMGLFKPQRNEFGDKKVFCANHYGEFIGHLLALNASIPSCQVELAHLSKYFSNIHKFLNNGTPIPKDGCISYSQLSSDDELDPGKIVISCFNTRDSKKYDELTKNDIRNMDKNDNIEVVLSSIEFKTRDFYKYKQDISKEYIDKKVEENRYLAIQMMVYDCLYGNNDRHDENWSMKRNDSDIELYSLYDNERVLGLYENQNVIEEALKSKDVERASDKILFSRMRVPGEKEKYSNYKNVLKYLMQNYKKETTQALEKNLSKNSPEVIHALLESCEGLPKPYIDFGTQIYKTRFEFARNLYKINSHTYPESPVEESR